MSLHRFAEAAERRDGAAMAALFAEDVTYHTPTLTEDLHGKDPTLRYLAQGTRIVDELEYTDQVSDDERLISCGCPTGNSMTARPPRRTLTRAPASGQAGPSNWRRTSRSTAPCSPRP